MATPKKYEHIDFTPPEGVANAAAKGLELRQKASPSNRGGLTVSEAAAQGIGSGVQRAVNLKNRDKVSPKVIKQMRGFLSRSEKSSKISPEHKGTPWNDKGYVAWLLWGGDPAVAWTNKVIKQMEAADGKEKRTAVQRVMRRQAGLLQPPPKMTEDVLVWVLSCWAKTVLAIHKAKGKKHFNERYMERLAAADSQGVVVRQGRPEQRTFPIDLQGWRYGDRRDAIFEGAVRKNRELLSQFPDSEALAAYKQQLQQTFQEYLDSGMPLRVTVEHSNKRKGNFNESTNTILIAFTSATTEKWVRKVVPHEMRHYAQILLSQSIDSASDEVFRAGLPSRSIRTPEYDQNQGTLYEDTRLYLHSLDDVEFYTNLADSIEEIKEALLAIPQEYDENTGRMDSLAREERFKEMVGAKSSPNIHRFFKYLKRNRKARGKYQKAVSEAYAALVDDVFSGGGSRFRLASENVPTNPKLWAKVQALAKGEKASITVNGKKINGPNDGKGFTVFPSAYANGWASKVYKDLGGGWKKKASTGDGSEHVGVFAPLPADLAKQFPKKDEDSSKAHVTLCYIGPVPDKQDQKVLVEAVRDLYADVVGPIKARLSGVDYFRSATGSVAYTKVVFSKDMGSLKDRLKSLLEDHGIEITDDHPLAFNPHVTLAYYDDPHAVWDGPVPKGSWTFNEVEVWGLPKIHRLPVGGSGYPTRRASLTEAWGPTLREARGKSKKDVGHGGLDEWFSGHGGAKGKGEDATWGDWVSISPVTKTLPSGKKVERGDIVGECGISDDPDWSEITKGGKDPLKCMPRQKAHDMPKKERAEKAQAKQRAERADSNRGKKPTRTPTFKKKKARNILTEWGLDSD
jgi:2'-5' RNA ligase